MPSARHISAAALAALALTLAACGGDDGGSGSGDTLDRAAVVKQVEQICKESSTKGEAIKQPDDITDPTAAAAFFSEATPVLKKEADDVAAIKGDDEVSADLAALNSALGEVSTLMESITAKAKAKDASGLQDVAKIDPLGQKVDAAAKKLGAAKCAE